MFIYEYMGGLFDVPILATVSSMFINDDEDFDPHAHRHVPKPTTYMETFVHMVKGSLGAGILAMPFAFGKVGLITALIGLLIIAMFATYCIHVLIQAQYVLCKRHKVGYLTYPQSMRIGVSEGPPCLRWSAKYFAVFVDIVLVVWQLGICCIYAVFISESQRQVCEQYGVSHPIRLHMCIVLIPLIIVNLPKNLKLLAPFSTAANILTILGLLLIFVYLLNIEHGLLDKVVMFGDVTNIPVFIGVTLFALEAVGVVLALEYHLKDPKQFLGFTGLFTICMFLIMAMYGIVGAFGYIKFGQNVSGSISLDLPQGEIKALAAKTLLTLAVGLSFPLQNYVAYEILWHHVRDNIAPGKKNFYDYCLRVLLVVLPWLLAVAVPQLGPFIGLFGALCLSNLGVIFPGLLELCVFYNDYGRFNIICVKDYIIIVVGITAMASGCYSSVLEIIEAFH